MENKKEIDGGRFEESGRPDKEKPKENNFISGDPSMITTDDVFALLGEQVVKTKNWSKIALAWNNKYNALFKSVAVKGAEIAGIIKQDKQLKESNELFKANNQMLDRRITELNIELQHKKEEIKEAEKLNRELKDSINNLMQTTENIGKENSELKEKIEIMEMKKARTTKKKKK